MAKNFDYIRLVADEISSFKSLHNYCRLAEEQQPIYPDASANNARKALEWLMKQMLKIKGVTVDERNLSLVRGLSAVFVRFITSLQVLWGVGMP